LKRLRQNLTLLESALAEDPRTARTAANINDVNDLVLSQEETPQTHRTIPQISRETGFHRSSVERIIRDDEAIDEWRRRFRACVRQKG